jgi:hypothetical protein
MNWIAITADELKQAVRDGWIDCTSTIYGVPTQMPSDGHPVLLMDSGEFSQALKSKELTLPLLFLILSAHMRYNGGFPKDYNPIRSNGGHFPCVTVMEWYASLLLGKDGTKE